jgi:hypothetical protein
MSEALSAGAAWDLARDGKRVLVPTQVESTEVPAARKSEGALGARGSRRGTSCLETLCFYNSLFCNSLFCNSGKAWGTMNSPHGPSGWSSRPGRATFPVARRWACQLSTAAGLADFESAEVWITRSGKRGSGSLEALIGEYPLTAGHCILFQRRSGRWNGTSGLAARSALCVAARRASLCSSRRTPSRKFPPRGLRGSNRLGGRG